MKPSHSPSFCQLTWFCALLLFFLFSFFRTTMASASEISYRDHCASIVPESTPTGRFSAQSPILHLATSYFKGGEQILGKKSTDQLFNSSDVYLSLYITENIYVTKTSGVYKVQARLRFRLPYQYRNYSGYGQWYHPRDVYRRRSLRFLLNGFFSEQSRKLCMVGKASWQSAEGKPRNLEAVFQFNHAKNNSTLLTSLARGTLKSLSSSNSPNYFEPIEIVSLPVLSDYNYTLASKGLGGGCQGGNDIPPDGPDRSLSLLPRSICSRFLWRTYDFEVEYAAGCKSTSDCGPFKKNLAHLSLFAFQCSEDEEKLRYILAFDNEYHWHYQSFDPKTTLIGEGSWNGEKNQLCIVACRMLNSDKSLEDVRVGDCSVRLSIQFPLVWNITDTSSIVGLVWTNKTATDPGHFKVTSSNNNGESLPGLKYEYTQVGKARELCPRKEVVKKNGDNFPKGNSYDMRFDMSVKHSKEEIAWGNGLPIFVNSERYGENFVITEDSGIGEVEESTNIYSSQMNISYKITFSYINLKEQIASLNSSLNQWGQLVISAEGVYDADTGHLCMVGCREIHPLQSSEKSFDCEMIIDVEFPPLSSMVGSSINGVIQSRRAKTDSLYFEQLNISSSSYYTVQVQESIWRMDLEIIMVLISNTLACLFVASQLFYVKKHPEVLPFISVVMLSIITLGHMIPLVLNLEALFIKNQDQQNVILRGDGWLELNEVSVRLVSLVVFLLLLRLLQLAWTARTEGGDGNHLCAAEKKTAFVSLLLYAVGGLIAFLVELGKNGNGNGMPRSLYPAYNTTNPDQPPLMSEQSYTLRYLKSYAGLVLDGFLLPQILFNIFQNSREKALSYLFYIGTTLVRLVPHAYDLYRVHNYMRQDFYGSYIYANHSADFYSIAWDVIIPCGCIAFAVIIWLQQRFGGSCVLPQKIRELGLYEKVPVVSSE